MADRRRARRLPVKRVLLLALLLLLVVLLFTLHRWLPGSWPGGSGASGFRRLDAPSSSDPTRVVAPIVSSPAWTAAEGATLRVVGPAGTQVPDWRAGVGRGGPLLGGDGAATVKTRAPELWSDGLRVRFAGGEVRHAAVSATAPTEHVLVHLPAAKVAPLKQAGEVEVRVVDASGGAPVAGAAVTALGMPALTTDAAGRVVLRGLREPRALRVEASGHAPAAALAHPQGGGVEVRLDRLVRLDLKLVDPESREEAAVQHVEVLDREGRVLERRLSTHGAGGGPLRVRSEQPASALEGARLRVVAPGRPDMLVPLAEATGEVALAPRGRTLELSVRGTDGKPASAPTVRARFDAGAAPGEQEAAGVESVRAGDGPGRVDVVVPREGAALLVVSAAQHAPRAVQVGPGDSAGARDVVLERGLTVPVLVEDAHGRPLAGARVVARCLVGGVAVLAEHATGPDGRVRAGPVPPGPVEILAHARGKAWAATDAEATGAMGTVRVRLEAGAALRLVVHDPLGAPLAGVRVTALAEEGAAPDAQPPEGRRWTTDASGALVLDDLAVRSYRLRLSLAGHADEELHGVLPGAVTHLATLVPAAPR
jgi:hypothetical protein